MAEAVGDADFDAAVVERSHETPVLVDFWAQWCGPCRALGPVLEQLEADADGQFVLVKINTDEARRTASQFGIRSIPAVKLFVGGRVVGEFVGALPGGTIRKFLDEHLPSEADARVAEGERLLDAGDAQEARTAFEAAVALVPTHAKAHLALARLALEADDEAALELHIDAISAATDEYEAAELLRRSLVFQRECKAVGGLAQAQARVDANDGDLDAWYGLGCCHAAARRWEPALEALLEVVMRKPKHRDAAAHQAMLIVFGVLGPGDDLRDTYQRKLQIYT